MASSSTRWAVWLLGVGETLVWAFIFYVFAALLLTWETELGWAKTDLALGLTIAILMAALASPISGRLIDAGLGRWTLTIGAVVGAAALAVMAEAESLTLYLGAWAVIGAAQGFCLYEPCFAVVTRALGENARPAITRITLAAGFASSVSFICAGFLLDMYDWRDTLRFFAAGTVLLGAPMVFVGATILERQRPPDDAGTDIRAANKAALRAAFRKPAFWLLALAFPIMALNHGILLNHIMPILDERQIDYATAVAVASMVGPGQVAGRIVMMVLERHIPTVWFSAISFGGVLLASFILIAAGSTVWLIFVFAILQGAAYGLTSIVKPVLTAEYLGRTGYGAIAGWLAMPHLAGFAFAPFIGALIWRAGGYDLVLPATAVFAGLGVVCIVILALMGRQANVRA